MYRAAEYQASINTASEWASSIAENPHGDQKRLIFVKVNPVETTGFFNPILHIDLIGVSKIEAQKILMEKIKFSGDGSRPRPPNEPNFPISQPNISRGSNLISKIVIANDSNEPNYPPEILESNHRTKKTILLPDIAWMEIPAGEFIYGEDKSKQTLKLERFFISRYVNQHPKVSTYQHPKVSSWVNRITVFQPLFYAV